MAASGGGLRMNDCGSGLALWGLGRSRGLGFRGFEV